MCVSQYILYNNFNKLYGILCVIVCVLDVLVCVLGVLLSQPLSPLLLLLTLAIYIHIDLHISIHNIRVLANLLFNRCTNHNQFTCIVLLVCVLVCNCILST